jgi:hypothetical protein
MYRFFDSALIVYNFIKLTLITNYGTTSFCSPTLLNTANFLAGETRRMLYIVLNVNDSPNSSEVPTIKINGLFQIS